jgi:hypothetical protein
VAQPAVQSKFDSFSGDAQMLQLIIGTACSASVKEVIA